MSRTQSRIDGDTPQSDGIIPLLPGADIIGVTAGSTFVRLATGEFSIHYAAAAGAVVIIGGVSSMVFRTGQQDFSEEFFGSTRAGGAQGLPIASPLTLLNGGIVAGTLVNVTVNSTVGFVAGGFATLDTVASGVQENVQVVSITSATVLVLASVKNTHATLAPIAMNLFTSPGGASGIPPFTGSSELTPVTSARPKGVALKSLTVVYLVTGAALTVPTVGMFATAYVNLVAPVTTTLIAQATNGLQTAANAQAYVTTIPVPVAQQGFIITPNTSTVIELDANVGAATTLDVISMFLTCSFNYN